MNRYVNSSTAGRRVLKKLEKSNIKLCKKKQTFNTTEMCYNALTLNVLTTIMEKLASLKQVHLGGELPATRVHPFGTHCPFEFKYTLHCVLVTVSCNKKQN